MVLAALLLPLIPGLIQGVLSVVDAIRRHPETPAEAKAELDTIAMQLEEINAQVQAVRLP